MREEDTVRYVFANHESIQGSNKRRYKVYEMVLFKDFKECLTKLGEIPVVSVDRTIELVKERDRLANAGKDLDLRILRLRKLLEENKKAVADK